MVADGGGGMAKVQDRRFETGDWPIRFVVPKAIVVARIAANVVLMVLRPQASRRYGNMVMP